MQNLIKYPSDNQNEGTATQQFKDEILDNVKRRLEITEPLSGDILEVNGELYSLYLGQGDIQQIASKGVGRFFTGTTMSVSGSVIDFNAPKLDRDFNLVGNLKDSGEVHQVKVWRFLNDSAGAGRGYWFKMPVKKWILKI